MMLRLGSLLALLGLAVSGAATASVATADASAPTHAACDADGFASVLFPAARSASDARAYWLDRHLLKWPQVTSGGRFVLYHSTSARLLADKGARVSGADGSLVLDVFQTQLPEAVAGGFKFVGNGVVLTIGDATLATVPDLLTQQVLLVHEDGAGRVLDATSVQLPGALDDRYAQSAADGDFGVSVDAGATRFKLWAPTARAVSLCVYATGDGLVTQVETMQHDTATGAWSLRLPRDLSGGYYTYLVDVLVPGVGVVRNRVTDPYSISLTSNSRRSYIADLEATALKPAGWDTAPRPPALPSQTDMAIYELHVRDFSVDDASVTAPNRGKYLAFTERGSNGMRHLRALANAGMTDVHLLPVFDFASVPEHGCITPKVPMAAPDSDAQQAAVTAVAARDCFNWGYDPYHFNAPEGSYASDAGDGAARVREFRAMVMALHAAGLRVGMDVVYNHTIASGQRQQSVLDRIVPGYYQRLDANGAVEHSTCCDNTATEHRMMAKLMVDSVASWAQHYRIDSFRFDLMGHQPRVVMEQLQMRVDAAAGRHVNLIGEGWNFGEVADGARFVQASQLSLNGSGIGTFSDRARDAIRGGSPSDHGQALVREQGYINGLVYDPNTDAEPRRPIVDLMRTADMVRVGLAGSLRDYVLRTQDGGDRALHDIDYHGQPAGYAGQPGEVVNYVENHDNQTLFDNSVLKLPRTTSPEDRARVQMLGVALVALSQGVAYFHAGIDTLRSKSMDRNSFDSGDWFNRLDWSYRDNHFGSGLPPRQDNGADYALIAPLLADPSIKPGPREIAFARDQFRDLLRIRTSSTLFRLRRADDVGKRLHFFNTGPAQIATVIAGHLDGVGYPGAAFKQILYLVNVDKTAHTLILPTEQGKKWALHPVQRNPGAADARPRRAARYEAATGTFVVPPRTVVVYVIQ
jgi:pullulanase